MRLYLLRLGEIGEIGAPVAGYLIQTDDGTNILVDCGYSRETIGAGTVPFSNGQIALNITEEQYVVNQLAQVGVRPEDVRYVVVTHLDDDHAGSLDEFPFSEFIIQQRHLDVKGSPRFQHARARWDRPGLRYRAVDGDSGLVPGVELVETSGHVPGHQSVLVRLPDTGPVLLAIDAIPHRFCLDPDRRPIEPSDQDEHGVRASTRKLVNLARREGATLIVYGHDGVQWRGLKTLPDYYS